MGLKGKKMFKSALIALVIMEPWSSDGKPLAA